MNIAIYCRVSTSRQENEKTIESQIADLENESAIKNYKILGRYYDDGYSGTLLARPALDRLRDDAAKGTFEAVLIHSPDRLARKFVYQEIVHEELKSCGVEILYLNRRLAETPEDQLLLGVQGLISEYERAKFMERTRRGRLHKVSTGHVLGSIPPYGYRSISKNQTGTGFAEYQINEDEAKNVRLMFQLLVEERMTTYGIIQELRKRGILARKGKNWGRSSVFKVLKNESYIGTTFYNKRMNVPSNSNDKKYHRTKNTRLINRPRDQWIPIKIPQIISPQLFERAVDQLNKNGKLAVRNQKHQYLLKGLIKCGFDKKSFYGLPVHGKRYYRCAGKNKTSVDPLCEAPIVNAKPIEEMVWNCVVELLANPELILSQIRRRAESEIKKIEMAAPNLESLKNELSDLEQESSRLVIAYSKNIINLDQLQSVQSKIDSQKSICKKKIEDLEKYKNEIPNENDVITINDYLSNYRDVIEDADYSEKSLIIRSLLKEVEITGRQVIIAGFLPSYCSNCSIASTTC